MADIDKTKVQLQEEVDLLRGKIDKLQGIISEYDSAERQLLKQNRFLHNILEFIDMPLYIINTNDYTITMANKAAWEEGISVSLHCYKATHQSDVPCSGEHACPLEEIKRTKQPTVVEHVHYDSDGHKHYVEVHGYPIFDDQDNVVQMIEYTEDITRRKKAMEDLKASEEQYKILSEEMVQAQRATLNIMEDLQEAKTVVESSRRNLLNIIEKSLEGILIVDRQGVVKFVNTAVKNIFGRTEKELLGYSFGQPLYTYEIIEATIPREDCEMRYVEMRTIETQWEGEKAYLVIMHDITDRNKMEASLRHAAYEWSKTFNSIGNGIALLNEEGRALRCNQALLNLLGVRKGADVVGVNCHKLLFGEQALEKDPFIQARKDNQRHAEIILKDKKWFAVSVDPILDQNKLLGAVYVLTDITVQKEAEQKLREDATFIESILETAQAIICVLNTRGEIMSVNSFAVEMLEYSRQELIGRSWVNEIAAAGYRDEIKQIFFNCLEGNRVKGYEYPVNTKTGQEIMISWFSSELRDEENGIIGIVIMGYDITQRKEVEKVQRLAQLGTLVSHMAHEVNNPLMVISGRAQLSLMEEIHNQELKENLDIIMSECQRAKDIIRRLLRFSRPSKGELKSVGINKTIEEVVDLIEHQFGLSNITIKRNFAKNLPQIVMDEKQMSEVFMNLLTNAFDAIEERGVIEITTALEGDFVRVEFKDSGKGIKKEILDRIFDPFFTTKTKGTGLGLSICYGIIKAHNGQLYFESIPDKGTKVIILLPFKQKEMIR